MSTVRIAVASTPLTATLAEAVPSAVSAVEEAARLGARLVCLPETALPGHRGQLQKVPDVAPKQIDEALHEVARAARRLGIAVIVGIERPTPQGRLIQAVVIDAQGSVVGEQTKTQIAPSEEQDYVPGSGRRVFELAELTFGIVICHEAFRYPEITRSLVLGGAQVIFVPHFVTTDDGSLPTQWCAASNPYNEKAVMLRAIENTVYVAAANNAGADQGSATCIIGPDGELVASVAYGAVGVVAADIELSVADAKLARRWAPERSLVQ